MKFRRLTPLASAALAAVSLLQPARLAQALPSPTRAEVLADLQVWRASGLATLDVDPSQAPFTSRAYLSARARYDQMRASPDFAALVRDIAIRRGEVELPQVASSKDRQQK